VTDRNAQPARQGSDSSAPTRGEVEGRYEAKVRAELAAADRLAPGADIVSASGALLAQVALVKGLPGPAEAGGGSSLSGSDGAAADSALTALGYDPSAAFRILSRPEPGLEREQRVARLRYSLEAVDPAVVIALDAEAAEDVREALGFERCAFGHPVKVAGRTVVAVDGLEASLGDPSRKKRVWKQWQSIRV
jgi:hypothetical protein